jgi:predicted ester cyclase
MSNDPRTVVEKFLLTVRSGREPERSVEFMAASVVAHQVISEEHHDVVRTPAEYEEHVLDMKREYGDFEFEIEELICEGSKVYARWRQRGNGVTQVTSCVYLVEDGLITEYWIQIDRLGLQLQSPKQ